ncbi:MAG: DUF2442 domain-containing protein [Elusimicrobia bacterium]|nr:DUF2442 domain-containing protein [Elusimicrobiota bacterium]
MHQIAEVKPLELYKVWVRFSDGVSGTVDLSDLSGKGVFAAWKDPSIFKRVSIDPESRTLCWPGGIDIAPEALYEDLRKTTV